MRSPYAPGGENQIAPAGERTGRIAFAAVALDPEFDQTTASEVGVEILEVVRNNPISGVQVEVGGTALAEFEPPETELIGLGFAVIVLIVALGSVLAMGVTVGVAVTGVGVGLALISIISNVTAVPEAATVIGAMIGLGVGIDYALFIVNRYRERLREGFAPVDAMVISIDTAGRSVIFAGLTVVVSLLGLMLMGLAFVAGLGIAASATVLVTMLASVTLLPAAIGIAKQRTEVTRVRGLAASLFVSLALFALGIGVPDSGAGRRWRCSHRAARRSVCSSAAAAGSGTSREAGPRNVVVPMEPTHPGQAVACRPCGAGDPRSTGSPRARSAPGVLRRAELPDGHDHPRRL